MLSRDEVIKIEAEESKQRIKWLSLACCDSNTLTALCLTASALLRTPNRKELKDKLKLLIEQLHEKGIYEVNTVIEQLERTK